VRGHWLSVIGPIPSFPIFYFPAFIFIRFACVDSVPFVAKLTAELRINPD